MIMRSAPSDQEIASSAQPSRHRARCEAGGALYAAYRTLLPLPEQVPASTVEYVQAVDRLAWIGTGASLVIALILQALVSHLLQEVPHETSVAVLLMLRVALAVAVVIVLLRQARRYAKQHIHALRTTDTPPTPQRAHTRIDARSGVGAVCTCFQHIGASHRIGTVPATPVPAAPAMGEVLADGLSDADPRAALTPRELVLLQLVAQGHTTSHIAAMYQTAPETIDLCLQTTMHRMGARTPTHAVVQAIRLGMII